MGTPEDFVRFLGRHFISLRWVDRTEGERAEANDGRGTPMLTSGFVVSVDGVWFLVTAGHILSDLEKAIERGQVLNRFHVADGFGKLKPHPPFVFDFKGAIKWHYFDPDDGADYGVIHLRENTQALLSANDVQPFDERAWLLDVPATFDDTYLVGIPDQFSKVKPTIGDGMILDNTLVVLTVEMTDEPPESLKKPFPRYYARVRPAQHSDGRVLTTLDGMSGCPLLGIKLMSNGHRRYWIIGIQSMESNPHGYAVICPFMPLGLYIASLFQAGAQDRPPSE
jgi:hypothetical protein